MDALIPALVVALLAELGDRTQLLVVLLGERFRRPVAVIAGVALAAAVNAAVGAAAGTAAAQVVNHRALRLMTGLALAAAGGGALFPVKAAPPVASWRLGAFLSSAGAFFILAFGDKTQFAVAALAGASNRPVLAAAGAVIGATVANAPAAVLGERWRTLVPLRAIRIAAGLLLLVAGLAVAVAALGIG